MQKKEQHIDTGPKEAGEMMSEEERLEEGIIESMDASDPPGVTRKGDDGHPVPSSGYRPEDWEDEDDKAEEED
jgi:hypothetical protein